MKNVFGSQRSGKSVKVLSELMTFKLKNPKEKAVVLSKDGKMVWNDKFTWLKFENLNNNYAMPFQMNFTINYMPEIHLTGQIPSSVSIDHSRYCPICGECYRVDQAHICNPRGVRNKISEIIMKGIK